LTTRQNQTLSSPAMSSLRARLLSPRGETPELSAGVSANMQLIDRARRGDADAFEELYHANAGRIYALCLRMSGDAVAASELTQDVFVRAWSKLGSFRGESEFSTWLRRLAVNLVLNQLTAHKRRESRVESTDQLERFDRGRSMTTDVRMDLEKAVAALPPGARAVFVLHDVEGYRHEDIARMHGVAVGTVKAQLHRARRLLQKMLNA
jgi:RNA polymerase sigma-70 factor (ECF subfamily)